FIRSLSLHAPPNTSLFTLSLHDALPIFKGGRIGRGKAFIGSLLNIKPIAMLNEGEYTPVGKVRSQTQAINFIMKQLKNDVQNMRDRKSTRLNSSHVKISYAVFCLKKKTT